MRKTSGFALQTPLPTMARGRVTEVHRTQQGTVPLFVFTVQFATTVVGSFGAPRQQANVIMVQPGFQNPAQTGSSPGGMVYLPSVGSVVLCAWDGHSWVILGCYTGPVHTDREQLDGTDTLRVSYNPGIETAVPRTDSGHFFDIADWALGMSEGDMVLSKGTAKVKVSDIGAIAGGDATCHTFWKADGERLSRAYRATDRMPGYWKVQDCSLGLANALLVRAPVSGAPVPDLTAYVYHCEIVESNPFLADMQPYLLTQVGHVSPTTLNDGRHAVRSVPTPTAVAAEAASRQYVVQHRALVQPLSPTVSPLFSDELDTVAATMFDEQVWADGSYRMWFGNRAKAPGAPTAANRRTIADGEVEYDAITGTYTLRVGRSTTSINALGDITSSSLTKIVNRVGTNTVTLDAAGALTASVLTKVALSTPTASVELTGAGQATVKGTTQLSLEVGPVGMRMTAAGIVFTGDVSVVGSLTVAGAVTAPAITGGGIPLSTHQHPGVKGGPDVSGPPI